MEKRIKRQPEFNLQKRVCSYLKVAHPKVLFMSDTVASLKLTQNQATRNSQIQKPGFKTPDLIIFAPRGKFHGLFIELKVESPYLLNGNLSKKEHIQGQAATIEELKALGYHASFQWEWDKIVKLINWYLNLPIAGVSAEFIDYPNEKKILGYVIMDKNGKIIKDKNPFGYPSDEMYKSK